MPDDLHPNSMQAFATQKKTYWPAKHIDGYTAEMVEHNPHCSEHEAMCGIRASMSAFQVSDITSTGVWGRILVCV